MCYDSLVGLLDAFLSVSSYTDRFSYFTFLLISHNKIENMSFWHVDKRLKNHLKNCVSVCSFYVLLLTPSLSGAKWYNHRLESGRCRTQTGLRLAASAPFDVRRCETTKQRDTLTVRRCVFARHMTSTCTVKEYTSRRSWSETL